jgi:hypothetical protein
LSKVLVLVDMEVEEQALKTQALTPRVIILLIVILVA